MSKLSCVDTKPMCPAPPEQPRRWQFDLLESQSQKSGPKPALLHYCEQIVRVGGELQSLLVHSAMIQVTVWQIDR